MTYNFKDLTGQKFDELTVISKSEPPDYIKSNRDSAHWLCKCSCGNTQIFRGTSLSRNNYSRCSNCAKKVRNLSSNNRRKSNVGYTKNQLTVIKDLDEYDSNHGLLCIAKCTCGNEIKICPTYIKNGNTKSCGCLKINLLKQTAENRRIDLSGKVFGYLTVIKYLGTVYKENYYYGQYECKCVCGNIYNVKTEYLKNGEVTSCGCKTPEKLSLAQGGTGIPYEHISLNTQIRKSPKYKEWRDTIFKKYNYTCQISNIRGNNLHVHHIVSLFKLIKQYNITKDNVQEYDNIIYDLNNGIVIADELHNLFHSEYGIETDYLMLNEFKELYGS